MRGRVWTRGRIRWRARMRADPGAASARSCIGRQPHRARRRICRRRRFVGGRIRRPRIRRPRICRPPASAGPASAPARVAASVMACRSDRRMVVRPSICRPGMPTCSASPAPAPAPSPARLRLRPGVRSSLRRGLSAQRMRTSECGPTDRRTPTGGCGPLPRRIRSSPRSGATDARSSARPHSGVPGRQRSTATGTALSPRYVSPRQSPPPAYCTPPPPPPPRPPPRPPRGRDAGDRDARRHPTAPPHTRHPHSPTRPTPAPTMSP